MKKDTSEKYATGKDTTKKNAAKNDVTRIRCNAQQMEKKQNATHKR